MVTKDVLDQLYTPIYDKFLLQTFAEEAKISPKMFDEITDKTSEWKFDGLSGLGECVDADEGSSGGYEDPVLGYPKTLTQAKRWKKIAISFESVDQEEYSLLGKLGDASTMGRGARMNIEKAKAAVLINGFSTASPDGQNLWSDSHPKNREETGTTYDNLLSGAFSHDNLELAETQIENNFFDPKGIPISPSENPILLYPPALRGAVKRVLSDRALERPGTTQRDINRFAGMYTPIEWRYLSSTLGGSDTAWFIIYPELKLLTCVWSAKPHFTSWIDHEDEFYNFKGRMLYDVGECDWRCGFASTGS